MKSREKAFVSPETRRLADLAGIDEDLQSTVAICQTLDEAWRQTPDDHVVIEALSTALLVRYNRCFTSGIRSRLSEELVASLGKKLQRLHRIIRDLRDKYIAHSVNPFEENIVVIELADLPDSRRALDISVDHRRFLGLKPDMIADVRDLASILSAHVTEWFREERLRVIQVAEGLSTEAIEALPEVPEVPGDWKSTDKKRAT